MNGPETLRPEMDGIQRAALIVGLLGITACAVGAWNNLGQFLLSYLLGYLFWIGVALGCGAILMTHHLTGGYWGFIIRRLLEAGVRTMPLMAVLILPLLFSLPQLYTWARPEAVAASASLQGKALYLNVPAFLVRTAVYFAVWLALAHFLVKWSSDQDRSADPGIARKLRMISGPGIVLYSLTVTFASIDWAMSLEPDFYSTIYGIMFMIDQALTAMAFVVGVAGFFLEREPLSRLISRQRLLDLGNLMLAFVMLWAYLCFSQFLIIWSGNLPEEIIWYTRRLRGGWAAVALLLVIFHFALPFLLLLMRDVKRKVRRLQAVAFGLLAVRLVDYFWVVMPSQNAPGVRLHWMDVAAPVGIGGIWIALFIWMLKSRPLVPVNDPELREMLEHERTGATA